MLRGACVLIVLALAAPAAAQNAAAPDLSGVWTRDFDIQNLLDPPESGPGPIQQHPRYPKTDSNGVPRRQLSAAERAQVIRYTPAWIPDATSPILQPKTRQALETIVAQELAGIPHPEMQTRCMPSGSAHIANLLESTQILQAPTEVVFIYQRDHQVRHVYLNQPHSKDPGHTWYGESVGHYEGPWLVVDTIGMNDQTYVDRFNTPHSDQIHVVERYRRAADGKRIEAVVTIEDPVAFTTTWSGRARYVPAPSPFLEGVCAENQRKEFWPGFDIHYPVDDTPDF
jgi:hypothetical protein